MIEGLFKRESIHRLSFAQTIFSYAVLGFWALVVLFPLYWLLVTSFKVPLQVNSGPFYLPGIDYQPTLDNWNYITVGDLSNDTWRPYLNTLIVSLVSSTITLVLAATAAYALVRFRYRPKLGAIFGFIGCIVLAILAISLGVPWPIAIIGAIVIFVLLLRTIGRRFKRAMGNNDIAFWMVSQRMLPPVAVVIPIYIMFQQLRLLDTRTALIITYTAANIPIAIWLLRDYFMSIPIELEESAAIDGASRYRIFRSIVLPLAVPGLVATFLLVLVFAWNEYLLALFLSSADAQTLPLLVAAMNNTRGPQWWLMSVVILIMIIPVIFMAIALERFIARGLLIGSVKG